jgi:hypothetical protein
MSAVFKVALVWEGWSSPIQVVDAPMRGPDRTQFVQVLVTMPSAFNRFQPSMDLDQTQ